MKKICQTCSKEFLPDAHFCSYCGARLGESSSTGSPVRSSAVRGVTVLFCDIVESTELAHTLEIEDLEAVYSAFREIVRREATGHGSSRIRFAGDGARIVFGHPEAREDFTERAVRCALMLVHAIAEISVPTRRPLALRAGLAYGPASVSDDVEESASSDEAVVGRVPSYAERVSRCAAPGEVVINAEVRRLVGEFFECHDLGERRLKGIPLPQRLWSVRAERNLSSRLSARQPALHPATRLIGRDREMAALQAALRLAKEGSAQALLLVGDAGIGKSRLAHEVAAAAVGDGALLLVLDCSPSSVNTPWYSWRNLLRQQASIGTHDDKPQARSRLEQWLGRWLDEPSCAASLTYLSILAAIAPETDGDSMESPELMRRRTIETLIGLLRRMAQKAPLVVLVEDLQWTDPTTREWIDTLIVSARDCRLLLVLTSRPEGAADAQLNTTGRIDLDPLDAKAALALVQQVAGETSSSSISEQAARWVVARSGCVPLYLEELTRMALEDYAVTNETAAVVPLSLLNRIHVRLDHQPAARKVSQAAATFDQDFSVSLLSEVLEQDSSDVGQAVAHLVEDGMLVPSGQMPDRWRFKHALIRDAIDSTIKRSERDRLHHGVARVLAERIGAHAEISPEVVAYHYASGRRHEDAARWYLQASLLNNARAAYREAIAHATSGLEQLEHVEMQPHLVALRRQLLIQRGEGRTAVEGYGAAEVERDYKLARELCRDQPDHEDMYKSLRGLATYFLLKGDIHQAYELSGQGLMLARATQRVDHEIDALCVHGYTSLYTTRLEQSYRLLSECLELYRERGGRDFRYPVPQDAASGAWALLPTAAWLSGRLAEAEDAIAAGIAHVEALDRPFDVALVNAWTAGTRLTQRRYADCVIHARRGETPAKQFGYEMWIDATAVTGALAKIVLEPGLESLQQAKLALDHASAKGALLNAPYYLWAFASGLRQLGDTAAASALVEQALGFAATTGELRINSELMLLQVLIEPERPDADRLLWTALLLAEQQEAVTTALRVALHASQRWDDDPAWLERVDADLAALDGLRTPPHEPGWVARRLAEIKQRYAKRADVLA